MAVSSVQQKLKEAEDELNAALDDFEKVSVLYNRADVRVTDALRWVQSLKEQVEQ